jgi:hypothetical protein
MMIGMQQMVTVAKRRLEGFAISDHRAAQHIGRPIVIPRTECK